MSKESRTDYDERLDIILSLLKKGLSPDQIDDQINIHEEQRRGELARKKGKSNERKVARLLEKAPYAREIERTAVLGLEDRAGYDMYVFLNKEADPLEVVGVQVKSSQIGIDNFLEEEERRVRFQKRGENNGRGNLTRRHFVMIDASLSSEKIIDSFVGQVEEMIRIAKFNQRKQAEKAYYRKQHPRL